MNRWKGLAILFSLLSLGAIQETFRIFTSSDPDIANNRTSLMPMGVAITGFFIILAIRFWNKSSKQQKLIINETIDHFYFNVLLFIRLFSKTKSR